jgi:hypothetical protein
MREITVFRRLMTRLSVQGRKFFRLTLWKNEKKKRFFLLSMFNATLTLAHSRNDQIKYVVSQLQPAGFVSQLVEA